MNSNETCNLCSKPNDQMLMLACVHDPCINCAASAYAEQIHIKGQSREVLVLLIIDVRMRDLRIINSFRQFNHY
jgi:hypothetical protein